MKKYAWIKTVAILAVLFASAIPVYSQTAHGEGDLDGRVRKFLDTMKGQWRDLNVPEEDGKILHEIILRNQYRKAVEVGTSTGHSAIWIAWALSRTGGKLITIEIDERRHRQALAHFKTAGLTDYIDARLADARKLVKDLRGPFDFVFLDADKDGYVHYAKSLIPKLAPGGCITAHNVAEPRSSSWGGYEEGTAEFYKYMKSLPEFSTRIHPESRYGVSVSYKKKSN